MNYLSVCSGIEAASAAWGPLGWNAVGFSEIEPFPCSVLAHHYPDVPNYGDITRYKEWDIEPGSIDVLVGGTPCQSFSVAGLRGGIEDARGNLALTFCGILDRFKPKWFIWENVPGVLSSWSGPKPPSDLEQGREWQATETSDFGQLMAAFSELGFGVAWRILDAQYWGVPQRRRRVFVVGCFGDWRRAAQVIFEPDCLSGNFKTGRKSRKDIAGTLASRTTAGGGLGTDFDLDGGLVAAAVTSRPYSDRAAEESKLVTSTGEIAHCLNAGGMGRQDYETETMVVAFAQNQRDEVRTVDVVGALAAQPGMKQQTYLNEAKGVRRLSVTECERLQGFPDDYTNVPHKGKKAADGPRYKAIGNSMAVPVVRWLGERIMQFNV